MMDACRGPKRNARQWLTWWKRPAPASRLRPGSGSAAYGESGGGPGADPSTIRFLRARAFERCQMHAVAFGTVAGRPQNMVVRTFVGPDGARVADPIGGGGPGGPQRPRRWVNFTARGGRGASYFACGGQVIGNGAELARAVRLRFTDETAVEDDVGNGVVLFYVDHSVLCPAEVLITDDGGQELNNYSDFALLA
jgi:hypothetical protein